MLKIIKGVILVVGILFHFCFLVAPCYVASFNGLPPILFSNIQTLFAHFSIVSFIDSNSFELSPDSDK